MPSLRSITSAQSFGILRPSLLIASAVIGFLISGCQADASKKSDDDLYELVHRYVLSSPLLDECIEEWGLGPENRFEMILEVHPSGKLLPLEVKDGDEDLNECLKKTVTTLRLPEGSVTEIESLSISIR